MNTKDALSILNLSGQITPTDIKTAYRKAAAKYHPDHNPAGLEMMKLVNVAYETLKDFEGDAQQSTTRNYGEAINDALNAIINFGLAIEICGAWVWLSGDTRTHREALKAAGFKWAPKKKQWYFRPEEYKSSNRTSWTMEKIREAYGSEKVTSSQKQLLAAAY
jgi:curved DNA-binding protein CbpA